MKTYFTITFYKHSNSSIHCIASITDHSIAGKRMADGIYEKGCLLYESCWVKANPVSHHPWGELKKANLLFDDNVQSQMVYGLIKGILAAIGIFDMDSLCHELGAALVEMKDGSSLDKEYILHNQIG